MAIVLDNLRAAAHQVGVVVELRPRPIRRCAEEIRRGEADGYPVAPMTPELKEDYVFPPQLEHRPNYGVTMRTRIMLYRLVGAEADWDGQRFYRLNSSVMIFLGAELPRSRLRQLNVPVDENTQTLEQLFVKLLGHRGDLAAGWESDGLRLLRDPRFAGRIEALPTPLVESDYYLMVSKPYWQRHENLVQTLWQALEKQHDSLARSGRWLKP